MRALVILGFVAGCGSSIKWTQVKPTTTEDLVSVWCTPTGGVYAVDRAGNAHDLYGRAARLPWDRGSRLVAFNNQLFQVLNARVQRSGHGGQTWKAIDVRSREPVTYGSSRIINIAASATAIFALGTYVAISNSLENSYAFLVRSDDGRATWSHVWTGPDAGPMGRGARRKQHPDVGTALAVLPDETVALAALRDSSILISKDGGRTFASRATPASKPLVDLWASPKGVLYGVGAHGDIVVSTDGGNSFRATTTNTSADLAAIAGCGTSVWIVGARGTALRY